MADDDVGRDALAPDQRRQAHAQRLHADQVELGLLRRGRVSEPPARVIFAKSRGLDQRLGLEGESVGAGFGDRSRRHEISGSVSIGSTYRWIEADGKRCKCGW